MDESTRVSQYLRTLEEEVEAYPDDINKARAYTEELQALPDVAAELNRLRREVLGRLRYAMPVAQIAEQIGLTPARVYKLLEDV